MCLDAVLHNFFGDRHDYVAMVRPAARPAETSKVLSFARFFFPALTAISGCAYLLSSHKWALLVGLLSLGGTIISFLWPNSQEANQANPFRGQDFGNPLRVRVGEALRNPAPAAQIIVQAPPPQPHVHYVPVPAAPPIYVEREVLVPLPAPRPAPMPAQRLMPPSQIFAPFVEEVPMPSIYAPSPAVPRARSHEDHVRIGRDRAPAPAPRSIYGPPARSHDDQVRVGSDTRPVAQERQRPMASSIYGPRVTVGEANLPVSDPMPAPRPARDRDEHVRVGEANRRRNDDESDPSGQDSDRVRVGSANS